MNSQEQDIYFPTSYISVSSKVWVHVQLCVTVCRYTNYIP